MGVAPAAGDWRSSGRSSGSSSSSGLTGSQVRVAAAAG